jgi:hypothetical protein
MLGSILPSGSLRDTYPLDFSAVEFKERKEQNAPAETPQVKEITVDKREYRAAKMGDARRIKSGDFAYLQSWQSAAGQMARARVKLRASQVVALLEAGVSTTWIDGVYFFSASHKVHPFNPLMKMQGSATWSNFQVSASPLAAATLTAEKAAMLSVPHFDGLELGTRATGLLVPTALDEVARLLLTVQDIILESDGAYGAGGVRNEHFQSGFKRIWAPQLTGAGSTADFYLFSEETIALGFAPWVIAEDAEEEVLEWDESSDLYKQTGSVRIEYKTYSNAALLWPHGIRLVKGT